MLNAIYTQESKKAVCEKAIQVAKKLRATKLAKAAKRVEDGIEEILMTYMDFPTQHWIQTNNAIERLSRKIKRRTKAISTFLDGQSIWMLVCWTALCGCNQLGFQRLHEHVFKPEQDPLSDIIAEQLAATKQQDFDKNY